MYIDSEILKLKRDRASIAKRIAEREAEMAELSKTIKNLKLAEKHVDEMILKYRILSGEPVIYTFVDGEMVEVEEFDIRR